MSGATTAEIEAACRDAQAHDFHHCRSRNGYDTDLGQGGVNVSGGQKQRLCIARAMLKKPEILILDDSTSAVDSARKPKSATSFYAATWPQTTVFIIAQRISSVRDADQILVLDDGKRRRHRDPRESCCRQCQSTRKSTASQQEGVFWGNG